MLAGTQHPVVISDELVPGIAADFLEPAVDGKNAAAGVGNGDNGGTVQGMKNEIVAGP